MREAFGIPFSDIRDKYGVSFKNVIHIGAHKAEEMGEYVKNGVEKVVWIEANPLLIDGLRNVVGDNDIILQAVVSDVDDQECIFNCATSTQSSSILEMDLHNKFFPRIKVEDTLTVKTVTLETLFAKNELKLEDFDFLNIDIQGAELLALKGAGNHLSHFKAVYIEINTDHMYKDCALVGEIDEYLLGHGLKRVETIMWKTQPWGDALYVQQG